MVSDIDGYQGIADEFIEGSSKNFEESPSERPTISTKNVQSNADEPNGLKGLKKEFKHGRLNLKDLYKQSEPLLTTSTSGKNNVQNPKRKQKRPHIDNEVDPEEINTDSESGSGELYHLNEKTIYKKLPPLYKTSSSKGMSANSNIQVTGADVPVGKQGLGSTEKGPLIKSSQESLKRNLKRKQKRPHIDNEVDPEEINTNSKRGSGELYHLNEKTIYKKLPPLYKTSSSKGMSANSNIQVTGINVPVGKQGLGSTEKGPPIKSSQESPRQNRKRKRPPKYNEVNPEEINMARESGSGELSHLNEKPIYEKLVPLHKTSSSKGMSSNSNIQVTGTNVPVGKQGLGSTEKGPPIKSSQESPKQNPKRKRKRPHIDTEIDPEEINTNSERDSGELSHLNGKTVYEKLAPLHKTSSSRGKSANSNIQVTGTNVPVGKQGLGSTEKGPPIKSSQESPKQNPKRKQPPIDDEVDPEEINTDSESGSGELSHLNEKTIYKKLVPLHKTSSSKGMSSNSNIQVTGTNVPGGKQAFGSMKKGLPTKSSQESPKQIPKREQPPIDNEVDLEEINMDSESGSRDVYQDMFGSEEPGNVVDPHLRTGVKGMKLIHSYKKGRLGA